MRWTRNKLLAIYGSVIFSLALILSGFCNGESYSDASTVKGITVDEGYARIKLDNMKPAEGCEKEGYYYLDTSLYKEGFSVILAAKAAGQKLSFQLVGCHGDMAKISHVYFCDKSFCN